jgi:hypothetical protein
MKLTDLLNDPELSDWIHNAARSLKDRDPCDAIQDVKALYDALELETIGNNFQFVKSNQGIIKSRGLARLAFENQPNTKL